jgi:diguanylate cyclase (GGDEF)-like protein
MTWQTARVGRARRAWQQLRRRLRRWRRAAWRTVKGSRRPRRGVSLATRLLLVLVAVPTTSTLVTIVLQDSSLSADLLRATDAALLRASNTVEQLLEQHLAEQSLRYRTAAASPLFVANLEAGHMPTLQRFAQELASLHGASAVLFLDERRREVAGAGDAILRQRAVQQLATRQALAGARRNDAAPTALLLTHEGLLQSGTVVPLGTGPRLHGTLVALEPLPEDRLASWARLSGATVTLAPAGAGSASALCVRRLDDLELRVAIPVVMAEEALANSRANLLTGGVLGLALAVAASIFLARSLVRPIRTVQAATARIRDGDLHFRLDADRRDEIGDVARAFNLMLDSLERNIDDRMRVEQQIRHLANHDSLTGLGNWRQLATHLGQAIERARRDRTGVGVIYLDLDRFKDVNDTLGHTAGDELLVEVARRLDDCVRTNASDPPGYGQLTMLARLGGDEFTIVLTDVTNRRQIERFADRVLAALARPFSLRGRDVAVSASLGIAMAPHDAEDAETLLRESDLAMYQAKDQGGSSYEFYADSMQQIAERRLALDSQLRRALDNDEFELFYQPKLQLRSGAVTGVEALLRWHCEGHGLVSPGEFIPLAEETGTIVAIGDWVLRSAMRQALQWQADGLPPVRVAVNVSVRQIQHRDDFVGKIAGMLAETGLAPELLELEITESVLLGNPESAGEVLGRLRELGVVIALDDFGTGYSALSQLRLLPIDTLKLDRTFIRGAASNPEAAALVGSIIAMAKVLGLTVVVEGVETRAQRRLLEELGCDEIQGYLLREPMAEHEATAFLRRRLVPRQRRNSSRPAIVSP